MTRTYNNREQKLSQLLDATVERRTAKAILVDVTYSGSDGEMRGAKVWFPLSQVVEQDGKVFAADWIIAQKESDLPMSHMCSCRIETVL